MKGEKPKIYKQKTWNVKRKIGGKERTFKITATEGDILTETSVNGKLVSVEPGWTWRKVEHIGELFGKRAYDQTILYIYKGLLIDGKVLYHLAVPNYIGKEIKAMENRSKRRLLKQLEMYDVYGRPRK